VADLRSKSEVLPKARALGTRAVAMPLIVLPTAPD